MLGARSGQGFRSLSSPRVYSDSSTRGLLVDHVTGFECEKAERSIHRSVRQTKLSAPSGRVSFLAASRLTLGTELSSSVAQFHCHPAHAKFDSSFRPESASPFQPAHARRPAIAIRPGINQPGWRPTAHVAMAPLSLAQLACPSLSAVLFLRSANLGHVIPVCLAQIFQCHVSA